MDDTVDSNATADTNSANAITADLTQLTTDEQAEIKNAVALGGAVIVPNKRFSLGAGGTTWDGVVWLQEYFDPGIGNVASGYMIRPDQASGANGGGWGRTGGWFMIIVGWCCGE